MAEEVTLREYVDIRFDAVEKAVSAALLSSEKAVNKAEIATEKRFDSVNEFRSQLADQAATLLTRTEYNTNHKALEDKIADITDRINRSEGSSKGSELSKTNMVAYLGVAVAILSVIVLAANHIFK